MAQVADPRDVPLVPMASMSSPRDGPRDCSQISLGNGRGAQQLSYRLSNIRFLVLASVGCMMFGSYYFFDQCSASKLPVQKQLKISDPQFGLLQVGLIR